MKNRTIVLFKTKTMKDPLTDITLAKVNLKAIEGFMFLRREKVIQSLEDKPTQAKADLKHDMTRCIELIDEVHTTVTNLDQAVRRIGEYASKYRKLKADHEALQKELDTIKENLNL